MNEIVKQDTVESPDSAAEDMEALRARTRQVMEREGWSQAEAGRRVGVAPQTFSAWLAGTYGGRNDAVAEKVRIGLDGHEARRRAQHILPPDIGFIETPTAKKILTHLQFAHYAPAVVAIACGAGVGKTMTARHYGETNANVWRVTAEPCTSTVYPMMCAVAEAMGIDERFGARMSGAIRKFMRGKGGLLIVDEAQHLGTPALDQLRALPDAVEVGLALMGNERVHARLGAGKPEFAQLYSRIGKSMTQGRPHGTDVAALAAAWGIRRADDLKLLRVIAGKGGALRSVSMTLRQAAMMAGGVEAVTGEHIRAAYADLNHQTIQGSV